MEYEGELYLNPIFDYSHFYEEFISENGEKSQGLFTDFVLTLPDKTIINAHRIILANSSHIFKNGIISFNSTTYTVTENPKNLMRKVIEFMYTGRIEFEFEDVMSLLHLANSYEIESLKTRLNIYIQNNITAEKLLYLADQCYNYLLAGELKELVPYFVRFFNLLSIQNLTEVLDIVTFASVLSQLGSSITTQERIDMLDEFIGNWPDVDDEDRQACTALFGPQDRILLAQRPHCWLIS